MSLDSDALNSFVGIAGLLIAILALWYPLLGLGGFKSRLRDEQAKRLDAARALTAPKPWDAYLQTLETALSALTRWMGERARLISRNGSRGEWGRSASLCISLAMIYPLAFLLISWLFGGTGTIGEAEFLPPPETVSIWRRALLILILLATGVGFYFLFRHTDRIDAAAKTWLDHHLWRRFPDKHRLKAKVLMLLLISGGLFLFLYAGLGLPLAGAGALALAGAGAGALAGAVAVAVALAGAVALAVALAGALAVAGAVAGALAGAGALALALAGAGALALAVAVALAGAVAGALAGAEGIAANTFSATFLLFFLLLPFVNALFDWTSWQVSRWLGESLLTISRDDETPAWWRAVRYVGDMVWDVVVALACLIGLAWAIPRVIDAFNSLIQWLFSQSAFAIEDYLCAAAKEPLGDGFWATSMLFSTLFPTAIHLAFLLIAPLIWLLTPSETNRARAAHLTHGTRPPAIDLRGKGNAGKAAWPSSMPANYGAQALREDQAVFQGRLNETTLHAITIQLRFLRPLYYAVGLIIVGALLYWLGGLFISSWRPLPEILLWIAHNFDYTPVRQCFPEAPPMAPFETLPI